MNIYPFKSRVHGIRVPNHKEILVRDITVIFEKNKKCFDVFFNWHQNIFYYSKFILRSFYEIR